jgi:hypothetical protein
MLPIETRARKDLELAKTILPDDVEEEQWDFKSLFQNMMKKLKEKYSSPLRWAALSLKRYFN